jgi:hypothetical protein
MADPLANVVEVFSAPIESVITALGMGIAEAQKQLDANSIATQEALDTDPILSRYGLQATWYQFPRVDLQLKIAVSVTQNGGAATMTPAAASLPMAISAAPMRLQLQPVSASYQTQFNYDAQASSTITLSIVPVTPPRPNDPVTIQPSMAPLDVQNAALASPAKFVTTKDAQGKTVPAAVDAQGNKLQFDINFNAASRLWYVLQYAPSNRAVPPVVVAVDDSTKSVRVINTP